MSVNLVLVDNVARGQSPIRVELGRGIVGLQVWLTSIPKEDVGDTVNTSIT